MNKPTLFAITSSRRLALFKSQRDRLAAMRRLNPILSKVAFSAILLFLASSSQAFAQVTYTVAGTLSLVSGTDPLGLSGFNITATATLSQSLPPSMSTTTTTYSTNSYSGVTVAVAGLTCDNPSTPPATVTLTDNVGAPDTISLSNCSLGGLAEISGSVTIPDGFMITAVPAGIPSIVGLISGTVTLVVSGTSTGIFALVNGPTLTATGTAPPLVTPSPPAWTPSAPLGSTALLSQNVVFTTVPPPAYAAVSFVTSVTTTDGGNWLSVTPAMANTSSPIIITVNPKGLTAPSYSGKVILNYGPDYASTTIPVTFTLTAASPSVISLSPRAGTGLTQTFSMVYSDPNGLSDLIGVLVLFNNSVKLSDACAAIYVPGTDQMYLYNDAGTGLSAGVTPGSPAKVSNSQCTLEGSGSSFGTSGNNLTVNAALTFSGTFVGSKNAYLYAVGKTHTSGWVKEGVWIPSSLGPPLDVSISPSSGTGLTQTFSAVYSDPDGLADLSDVVVLFNASLRVSNACAVVYIRQANQLYLYNDAGTGLSAGVTPGSSAQVSNSQCTLAASGSSLSSSGNDLTVNVALTFSGTFGGAKNVYLYAVGKTQSSAWVQEGDWTP